MYGRYSLVEKGKPALNYCCILMDCADVAKSCLSTVCSTLRGLRKHAGELVLFG
jgi:hypothetical protein